MRPVPSQQPMPAPAHGTASAQDPSHASAPQPIVEGRFGPFLADLGIGTLFWMVAHTPALPRLLRGPLLEVAWMFSCHARNVTTANLRRTLPAGTPPGEVRRRAKEVLGSFYDFVCDVGRTARLPREKWDEQIAAIEGQSHWEQARQAGKGAIIATAHMGSFEAGLCAMLRVEKRIHVVFKRDASSRFERLRNALRENLGIIEAPVDEGLANWIRLRDALLANEVVAMQADRVMPGQKGIKVPFLGGHVLLPDGPVRLAAITGSPILPVFTVRQKDGRIRVIIEPAIAVDITQPEAMAKAMERLAAVIAQQVARYPEQWLVLQRAWLEDQPDMGERR